MITAHQVAVERGGRIVLNGADLTAGEGQVVGVVGPNGSGKSTLLGALYRELDVAQGRVDVDGDPVASLTRRQIAQRIAVVAQDGDSLMPLSVRDTVNLGRLASRSLFGYGDEADHDLVDAALAQVGLTDLADRLVTELSGGERQRVLIARAIAQQATHLLLDEPTNHLDLRHQFALLELVSALGCTTVMVLHDLNLAARACDRILLLDQGEVVAAGTPSDVLTPENLEPVYRLVVHRLDHAGHPHLHFEPRPADQSRGRGR